MSGWSRFLGMGIEGGGDRSCTPTHVISIDENILQKGYTIFDDLMMKANIPEYF